MTEEQIAFLAETLAEEIEQHHDNHMDVDVGIHDLARLAGEEMAKEGVVRDLVDALEKIAAGKGVYGLQAHEYKQIASTALVKARGQS